MSKERLEEILEKRRNNEGLNKFEIDWLAERVQELESLCRQIIGEEWMNDEGLYKSEMMKLTEQNKRYREALNDVGDELEFALVIDAEVMKAFKIIEEALEENK